MKKINLFLLTICIALLPSLLYSQTTIFSENFGTPGSTTSVATYTGFQNYGVQTYTGNADVRTTVPSTGYVGASGSGNLFITSTANTNLTISGINTMNYNTLSLTLAILKTTNGSKGAELGVQVSADAVTWTDLVFTMNTGAGSSNIYTLFTPTGTIPSTGNLRIRFVMKSVVTGLQFRIDDIKLTGIANIILPVTMGSFNVQHTKQHNILSWETYSENNVDKFIIMKSLDGYEWKIVGEVKATGNSFFKRNYSFNDIVEGEINYYQIRTYDNDGSYEPSKVIGINNKTDLIIPKNFYNILGQEILYGTEYTIPGQ